MIMKKPINKIKYYPHGSRIDAIDQLIKKENSIIGERARVGVSPQRFLSSIAREKQSEYGHKEEYSLVGSLNGAKLLSWAKMKKEGPIIFEGEG